MQVKIMANTYALISSIKVCEIESLKKRQPDALKVKDKDGNDVFAIGYTEGKDSVTKFGITFGSIARDGSGKAVLVGTIPANVKTNEDAKSYVEEQLHAATVYLKQLEKDIPEAAKRIAAEKEALMSTIEVS